MISTYQETLAYLYRQLPMFQRIGPKAFKKDLSNTIALCNQLGNPQELFPAIHIAGTNGKGSTAHLIAAMLQAHGLRVGMYTSPHYRDFRERIKINGELMSEEAVVHFVDQHNLYIEELNPSFFEITVGMAFDYFAREQVDIAVIETGLGGRLDSTNVISPLVSLITNISWDHMDFLGDTLEAIAGEKAGIIKRETPVVIGETQEEVEAVFRNKAQVEQAPISFADQNWEYQLLENTIQGFIVDLHQKKGKLNLPGLAIGLSGAYQHKNLLSAMETLLVLEHAWNKFKINVEGIRKGLQEVKTLTYFLGRWHVLGEKPIILADSAHNEGGVKLVLKELEKLPFDQLHFIWGTVKDKDPGKILSLLPQNATYYFAKADVPRGQDAHVLQEQASNYKLKGEAYGSVSEALKAAQNQASANDLIYIGGSIFVVAEVI